jgi:hypothetical protein
MFNNLLYIYSKDNGVINKYINENENNFEIKKLKYELNKKDNELKILQKRYNKLLNKNIMTELDNKIKHRDNIKIEPNITKDNHITNDNNNITNEEPSDIYNICEEYEKV